jgi:hypothetical protein
MPLKRKPTLTKRFLCWIGWHDWKSLGMTFYLNPCPLEQCCHCGMGRQFNIAGFCTYYLAEEMPSLALDAEEKA